MKIVITLVSMLMLLSASRITCAECYGSGEYRVCSETYTDSDGDIQIRSWDSEGNSYSVNTESSVTSDGSTVRSYDSEGNEYSVRSWSDSTGVHTEDSEGNRCTITYTGQMIGCD